VLQALSHWHHRAFGFVYLNPNHPQVSVDEFNRCVRDGPMVGVKLWWRAARMRRNWTPSSSARRRSRPLIFQHTWIKTGGNLPGESTPMDLVELARRHPAVPIICGHTGGTWSSDPRDPRREESLFRPGRLRPHRRLCEMVRARAWRRARDLQAAMWAVAASRRSWER